MVEFIENAESVARDEILRIEPGLETQFVSAVRCMAAYPELAGKLRGAVGKRHFGDEEYIRRQASAFVSGRTPKIPKPPKTVPDEMVSVILLRYFEIDEDRVESAKLTHQWSMAAENFVGELLERYLASSAESSGWVWCAGSILRAIDFIKAPEESSDGWLLLQVKNRDNSENSSSSSVRDGTEIQKWFRTFSRTGNTNWPQCPLGNNFSEEGFIEFAEQYFEKLDEMS